MPRTLLCPAYCLPLLAGVGCRPNNTAGPDPVCTNPTVTITSPAEDAAFTLYQSITFTGASGPAGCPGTLTWTLDGTRVSGAGANATQPIDSVPPGRSTIQLDLHDLSLALATATGHVWVVLGRELLYDRNHETSIWRTDGQYDIEVTNNGGNPAWSPDRNTIAFVRSDGNDLEIFTVDRNGGNLQQVTQNGFDDYAPAWSPSGGRLAYVSEVPGNPEIFLLTLATGALTRLTTNTWQDTEPEWKGNLIAYQADPGGGDMDIFTIKDDLTQNPVQLTNNSLDDVDPHWSPDGSKIVFSRESPVNHDIWVMDANGGSPTNLTSNAASDREPEFSPDGQWIVFVSDRSGSQRLWIMKAAGLKPVEVRVVPANSGHPRWRP